jgi:hypothetical protein
MLTTPIRTALVLIGFMLIPAGVAEAKASATMAEFTGEVSIFKAGEKEPFQAEENLPIEAGDTIITGNDSSAEILIDDGSMVTISENTEITFDTLMADYESNLIQSSILMRVGRLFANISRFVHGQSSFSVSTPTAVAGVRGTEFVVEAFDSEKTDFGVFDGELLVEGVDEYGSVIDNSRVTVTPGTQTQVLRFKRPIKPVALKKHMRMHRKKIALLRQKLIKRRMNLRRIIKERMKFKRRMINKPGGFKPIKPVDTIKPPSKKPLPKKGLKPPFPRRPKPPPRRPPKK